jgi:uroporphyrinogen-III synthase
MPPLRLIVTRPAAQAEPWVQALRALGFDAVALPLIGIEPLADPAPVHEAWRLLPGLDWVDVCQRQRRRAVFFRQA